MIFYGSKASKIDEQILNVQCDNCKCNTKQIVTTFGKYFHIYWIPFVPIGKEQVCECQVCHKTIPSNQFNHSITSAYNLNKPKTLIRHWSGSILIALIGSILWLSYSTRDIDPRTEIFNALEDKMTSTPSEELDSTAYLIKTFFDDFVNEDMNPGSFEYYTEVNNDKLLILVKMPMLKNLAKDQKPLIVDMINQLIDVSEGIKYKNRYIGIKGSLIYDVGNTPHDKDGKIRERQLYDYLGDRQTFGARK